MKENSVLYCTLADTVADPHPSVCSLFLFFFFFFVIVEFLVCFLCLFTYLFLTQDASWRGDMLLIASYAISWQPWTILGILLAVSPVSSPLLLCVMVLGILCLLCMYGCLCCACMCLLAVKKSYKIKNKKTIKEILLLTVLHRSFPVQYSMCV